MLPCPRLPVSLAVRATLTMSLVTGCDSGGRVGALAVPVHDTLPGGIPRVMSPGPTRWEGETGWQLELVQEFRGEEGASSELLNPQSLAVGDDGRVYVVDRKPAVIKVYDLDGSFVRTIGSEGRGPGEFQDGSLALHEGKIVLHDPQVARTSVWDTVGTFVGSWSASCCFYGSIHVDREGRVHIPSIPRAAPVQGLSRISWIRHSMEGVLLDTLRVGSREAGGEPWTVRGDGGVPQMTISVPLQPSTITGYHPDGGFVTAWSGDYQIAVSPNGRDTTGVFGRTWQPEVVTSERRTAVVEAMVRRFSRDADEALLRRSFTPDAKPATAPAFTSLHVDPDGNRWVRLDPGTDSAVTRFDIFDPDGVFLGPVAVRPALPQYARVVFRRGELLVLATSAEGYSVIRRYRVRRD